MQIRIQAFLMVIKDYEKYGLSVTVFEVFIVGNTFHKYLDFIEYVRDDQLHQLKILLFCIFFSFLTFRF